jgi:hypothetical protein
MTIGFDIYLKKMPLCQPDSEIEALLPFNVYRKLLSEW